MIKLYIKLNIKRLGDYCKFMRHREGYSLRDVAKNFNSSPSNLSRFERGLNDSARLLMCYLNYFANDEDIHKIIYKGAAFYDTIQERED